MHYLILTIGDGFQEKISTFHLSNRSTSPILFIFSALTFLSLSLIDDEIEMDARKKGGKVRPTRPPKDDEDEDRPTRPPPEEGDQPRPTGRPNPAKKGTYTRKYMYIAFM